MMKLSRIHPRAPVHFRMYADFDVDADMSEARDLSSQQRTLLHSILASREAMQAMGRMTLLTDLCDLRGPNFTDVFTGPSDSEILDSVLFCLPDEEKPYSEELRGGPGDTLPEQLMPVFLVFRVSLHRAGLDDVSSFSEGRKIRVGPTLDALKDSSV